MTSYNVKSLSGLNCQLNPIPEKKVRIVIKNQKGKAVKKMNRKQKLQVFYSVGKGKLLPMDKEPKKHKYKNYGDEITRLYNRAYEDFLKRNEKKGPDVKKIITQTGKYTDPAYRRKNVSIKINQVLQQKKIKGGKKHFTEKYEYTTTSKINQKNIFEKLELNKFSRGRKYKNVEIRLNLSLYDKDKGRMVSILPKPIHIKDVKKSIKAASKKWSPELFAKFDHDTVNLLYFTLRTAIAQKGLSMSPQAYKFQSEIKQQHYYIDKNKYSSKEVKKSIKGKNFKIPGRKLKLLNNFQVYLQVDYNK
jgi:ribosomal protein L33